MKPSTTSSEPQPLTPYTGPSSNQLGKLNHLQEPPTFKLDYTQRPPTMKLDYMQRPPKIVPNYGKKWKHGVTLKTNLPRVLLYDNVTQQTILDAQLSYIQSQRHKSRRHIDMNIKSFLLWKQRKETALHKLTQVPHGHDYAQFQMENYNSGPKLPGKNNDRTGLSYPQSENDVSMTTNSMSYKHRVNNQKHWLSDVSYNGNFAKEHKENPQCLYPCSLQQKQTTNCAILPEINSMSHKHRLNNQKHRLPRVSYNGNFTKEQKENPQCLYPCSLQQKQTTNCAILPDIKKSAKPHFPSNGRRQTRPLHECMQQRNGIAKFEHYDSYTSKSNSLTNDIPSYKQITSGPESLRMKRNTLVLKIDSEEDLPKNKQVHRKQPVFDNRFVELQNLLIKQCPGNEGFALLSPSFLIKNSFNYDNNVQTVNSNINNFQQYNKQL